MNTQATKCKDGNHQSAKPHNTTPCTEHKYLTKLGQLCLTPYESTPIPIPPLTPSIVTNTLSLSLLSPLPLTILLQLGLCTSEAIRCSGIALMGGSAPSLSVIISFSKKNIVSVCYCPHGQFNVLNSDVFDAKSGKTSEENMYALSFIFYFLNECKDNLHIGWVCEGTLGVLDYIRQTLVVMPPASASYLYAFFLGAFYRCLNMRVLKGSNDSYWLSAQSFFLAFFTNKPVSILVMEGRLGEAPRPELREHGRISGACFDAARGITPGLKVRGTDYKTSDGTCIRDYIDVTDLVDAHVKALEHAQPRKVGIYNVGTGKGSSVKEFVEACKKATGVDIKVDFLPRRPGDYAEVFSDPSKILRELNWSAQHTNLQESLHVAWRWQKAHRDGYGTTPLVLSS
ncbi:UDP-arabinose 4-epimerase 1 [Pyrus ussuriensis x Pyrus communis]|uniref:UDP-arabinose 4-epimerase 1 n=1 Tax=Pyrus ussuriensis x Pyrus communis TaxID=2448454 RepID=A0A5N5IBY9_9ROSA|nr:UDP-arabinose 4-epimerase 1 [Pyrus ussuriensis x Pyrus communis]